MSRRWLLPPHEYASVRLAGRRRVPLARQTVSADQRTDPIGKVRLVQMAADRARRHIRSAVIILLA